MIIEKSELAGILAKVKVAMPSNPNIAALKGILIKEDRVTANNLEIAITAKLSTKTDTPFILPSKAIDMIASLPDGEIEITTVDGGGIIKILAAGIKNSFAALSPNDFAEPAPPDTTGEPICISSKKLHDMVSSVLYAASTNNSRPTATGVLFDASNGKMNVVAVDGYRAAWNKTEIDGEFRFTVPRTSLEKMLKLSMSGDIKIAYGSKSAVFESDKYSVYTRLIEGNEFNYRATFPARKDQIVVNRPSLLEGINRILICDDGERKAAIISFTGAKMKIAIETALASYSEEIEVHGDTDEQLRIGLNAYYMRDALKSYNAEHITMSLDTAKTPVVFSDDELLSMLLPVRLHDGE